MPAFALRGVRLWGGPEEGDTLLVRGSRIAAVGCWRELRRTLPAEVRVEERPGTTVVPGFHDGHLHLVGGAVWLAGLDLREAPDAGAVARAVEVRARVLPRGCWIRGFGWRAGLLEGQAGLAHRLAPEHRVVLARADGHALWLNRAAARALGRREGIVEESAAERVRHRLPALGEGERLEALARALARLNAAGVTSCQEILTDPAEAEATLGAYAVLRSQKKLSCRMEVWLPLGLDEGRARALRRAYPPSDPWLAVGYRKVFLDGTLAGRTAALEEPYADAATTRGRLRNRVERLVPRLARAAAQGWPLAFHAVGDRAVRAALDVLEALPRSRGRRCHRIEHAQLVRPADFERARRLGVAVCVQPLHLWEDRAWAAGRLGRDRASAAYPWRAFLRAGVPLVLGSDWPVAAFEPLEILRAACRRPPGPWHPEEALDLHEAVEACTRTPARLMERAVRAGRLVRGGAADFVLLSGPLEALFRGGPPPQVLETWVGGRRVWSALEERSAADVP